MYSMPKGKTACAGAELHLTGKRVGEKLQRASRGGGQKAAVGLTGTTLGSGPESATAAACPSHSCSALYSES